jgi:hypothetical protein
METHVKVLGGLHVVLGILGLLTATLLGMAFGGAAGIVGASGEPGAEVALPIIGITGTALVVFVTALSLPAVIIGAGLLGRRHWARLAGLVLSTFAILWVPFGTIVGIYGLWVLLSKGTEQLFVRPTPVPPSA